MAIINNENKTNQTAQAEAQMSAALNRGQGRYQSNQNGFGAAGAGTLRTFRRKSTSALLQAYEAALAEITNTVEEYRDKTVAISVFGVDGDLINAPISAIVVAREEKGTVAYSVLSLAATCAELPDVTYEQKGRYDANRTISIPQVPGDVWQRNGIYRRNLEDHVASRYKGKDVVFVGNIVLPAHITPEDKQYLHNALFRLIDADEYYLQFSGKFESYLLNFQDLDSREQLKSRLEFNQPQSEDSLGNPLRADVTITTNSVYNNGDQEKGGYVLGISTCKGYVDAVYEPIDPEIYNTQEKWTPSNVQSYLPAFVITSLDAHYNQNTTTVNHLVLSLVSASLLAERNRWVNAYRPTNNQSPLRDIGALGVQVPRIGDPIDMNGGFEPMGRLTDAADNFRQVAQWFFHHDEERDGLLFFVDVEESGEISPIMAMLTDIADGDAGALESFLAAADSLTSGKFSEAYERLGSPVLFADTYYRSPLGTIKLDDKSDKDYDIRSIDTLAICATEDDQKELEEITDAIWTDRLSSEERTESVVRYIDARFPGMHKITGYARRIQVLPAFFAIAVEAFKANHVSLVSEYAADVDFDAGRRGGSSFRGRGYDATNNGIFRGNGRTRDVGGRRGSGLNNGWSRWN